MNSREFEDYLRECKKDMFKTFNLAKKIYLQKFQNKEKDSATSEENQLYMALLEKALETYINKKFT